MRRSSSVLIVVLCPALAAAQRPICDPCVDGPEQSNHHRQETPAPIVAAESEEIVIADELRTAFYEHAPRSLAAAMSKAVGVWCATADHASYKNKSKADAASWLCQG